MGDAVLLAEIAQHHAHDWPAIGESDGLIDPACYDLEAYGRLTRAVLALAGRPFNAQPVAPPKFVRPCIPTTAKAIPHGAAWLHEPKLDGYRFQIVKHGDRVRLYIRSGYDWTKRLASLATALTDIRCKSAVIDGELVFPNASGNPEFRAYRRYGFPPAA